jgi:hypothetical protein
MKSERDGINPAVNPSGTGCVECLGLGGWWLHPRRCAQCGHIGCCDNSPSQHASITPLRVTRQSRASSLASDGFTTIVQRNSSPARSFPLLTRIRWIKRCPWWRLSNGCRLPISASLIGRSGSSAFRPIRHCSDWKREHSQSGGAGLDF